jgi:hypothetical protein
MYKIGTSLKNWCWPLLWPTTCPADDSLKLWKKKNFHYYLDVLSILAWRVVSEAVVQPICPADRRRPLQLWLWAWTLPMCIMNMPKLDLGGWIDGPHFISKSILFNWYRVCFAICKPKAFMSTLMHHGKLSFSFLLWRKWKWLSRPLFHIRSFITHWNRDNSLLASDCQSPVDVSDSWKCTPRGPQRGKNYKDQEGAILLMRECKLCKVGA